MDPPFFLRPFCRQLFLGARFLCGAAPGAGHRQFFEDTDQSGNRQAACRASRTAKPEVCEHVTRGAPRGTRPLSREPRKPESGGRRTEDKAAVGGRDGKEVPGTHEIGRERFRQRRASGRATQVRLVCQAQG